MAGHSHWAGIKHKKDRVDKTRSKIFSKLSKEITVAAKLGDKDPNTNSRLRSAIQSARSANMPKDNIERAIDKSKLSKDHNFEHLRYEGFGPNNVACIVEALTDNKNRTASNIRTLFQKNGGSLGSQGSASHNFKQIGVIKFDINEIKEDILYNYVIDLEIDDLLIKDDIYEIHCEKNEIYNVKKKLEIKIKNFISTKIEWIPINLVIPKEDEKQNLYDFINSLEDNEDVQNVYTNLKFID